MHCPSRNMNTMVVFTPNLIISNWAPALFQCNMMSSETWYERLIKLMIGMDQWSYHLDTMVVVNAMDSITPEVSGFHETIALSRSETFHRNIRSNPVFGSCSSVCATSRFESGTMVRNHLSELCPIMLWNIAVELVAMMIVRGVSNEIMGWFWVIWH